MLLFSKIMSILRQTLFFKIIDSQDNAVYELEKVVFYPVTGAG